MMANIQTSKGVDRLLFMSLVVVIGLVAAHLFLPELVVWVQDLVQSHLAPILGLTPAEPYW